MADFQLTAATDGMLAYFVKKGQDRELPAMALLKPDVDYVVCKSIEMGGCMSPAAVPEIV